MAIEQFLRKNGAGRWIGYMKDHPGKMLAAVLTREPDFAIALRKYRTIPGKVDLYQAGLLYMLARQYNRTRARLLDFGTMHGWSASIIAAAAPRAMVCSLEPDTQRRNVAKQHLASHNLRRVQVLNETSMAFYSRHKEPISLVFVDGDHHHCENDMPLWELIKSGGIMVFHDYMPKYQSVMLCVDQLCERLGKERPDVLVINARNQQGMAGVYKDG